MSKSIIKDTLILCIITLVCGLFLGGVYSKTKVVIDEAALEKASAAAKVVLKEAQTFEMNDELSNKVADQQTLFEGQNFGDAGVTIDSILVGKSGRDISGYVINAISHDGYGGDIKLSIGINQKGEVSGIEILEINETAGLGMRAKEEPEFRQQYVGKAVKQFKLVKGGKSKEDEIDALSGASVTSNAFTNAVNASLYFYSLIIGGAK